MNPTAQRHIPLLNLQAQHESIRDEVLCELTRVVDSQKFIMGEDVQRLEKEIAEYCSASFAIGCASGSDALFLALLACGIGSGDTVLTSPFTFFATAGAITHAGATPVFIDIEQDTFNVDPAVLREAVRRTPNTKAIIPVHLFGGCADMDPILEIAHERNLLVIEDGAQAIGAEYKGRRALSIGDIGCMSFFPSKNLGGFGDGGMLTTNDEHTAKKLSALRLHGATRKYYHEWVGINSRLDTLQAALLRVKLRYLDSWTEARQRNADRYRRLLHTDLPITLPSVASYQSRHVYNQFVIRCPQRDELKSYLQQNGVGTEIYYPLPLHLQRCYRDLGYRDGDFPVSERAALEVLALPVHSDLPAEDIDYICELITSFYQKSLVSKLA